MAAVKRGRLMVPLSYTAFDGDLRVQLQTSIGQQLDSQESSFKSKQNRLQISRLLPENGGILARKKVVVDSIDIYPDPFSNVTQILVPCQHFTHGGTYELEIVEGLGVHLNQEVADERLKQQLDVRWPVAKLSVTPESIGTYPEQPVDVILEFPTVQCDVNSSPYREKYEATLPEFWLELYYCGHEVYCDSNNVTKAQTLYAELIRGFPNHRVIQLRCELFGLAGHYVLKLRPAVSTPAFVTPSAFIKVRVGWGFIAMFY